ncbi:aminotransferase class I/II-fold pyridoxal phosphate-dependent enzyme [Gordonia sp. JH63]|uniref:cysteine-S-conjugate beta-lyase n=1 Tax=Gordonia hongkongensis TaxID=1701090 RepID=A0AAX3T762_9ACTN|nr:MULTISPECIES: aminotransferase class I/II-fold pyridoxal phosphate-dependent enzyme [Gordonia]QIK46305.1 aminotransferase class I/II-fold pyridoxal phosphate-dependent enzyme [Gordonia terrae]KSU52563.1 aminotransferase [Gordonia sp. SGD-V-85]MCX2755217.1 aminotransferase class I/II-fold pyridoxal phosphate-dependent enzyme [Gordonia sp. 4N]QHD87661.1 aminotransferase class I/II-fold pyridoxal phosphate-dependent enzyme [Gordonia sp. JH63]WFP24713.1 aminotransferase class I/II-fold pyridoxa
MSIVSPDNRTWAGRTGFDDLELTRLSQRSGAKWARVRTDGVIPAWVADMDFPLAPEINDELVEFVARGDLGYPDWLSGTPLRSAFARRMLDKYGWNVNPAHVREQTDLIQALQLLLRLSTAPGDAVAIQTPNYPPFLATLETMRLRSVEVPFRRTSSGWCLDFDEFEQLLRLHRPKVLVLVNPHNPTGRVHTRAELNRIAELADQFDLLVISDEIHAELVYRPHRHIPFGSINESAAARTVTITSAGKAFNLAGLRCAVVHYGSRDLLRRRDAEPPDLYGTVSVLGVIGHVAAWQKASDWHGELIRVLDRNRRRVHDFLGATLPEVVHHLPEATYLSWVDVSAFGLDDPVDAIRRRGRVLVDGGRGFGGSSADHIRINFATSASILEQILEGVAAGLIR